MSNELFDAIRAGDTRQVISLIDRDPSLTRARTAEGVSGMLLALYHGHSSIAELIIERQPDLDLFEAAASGRLERVRRLVDADPSAVNATSSDGYQPLGLACFFGHEEVARLLLDHGADVNAPSQNSMKVCPIHAATARRSLPIIRLLLDRGADPNARQQMGFTPLHAAAQSGDTEIIRILLAHAGDRDAAAEDGRTPSMLAEAAGHAGAARILSDNRQ